MGEEWSRNAKPRFPGAVIAGLGMAALLALGGCGAGGPAAAEPTAGEAVAAEPQAADLSTEPRTELTGDRAGAPARATVALVLSSGGLRGLAHLGVLKVLEAHGLQPDLVVGSSVGAVIGVAYAAGAGHAELPLGDIPPWLDPWGSWLITPTQRRDALEAYVNRTVGARQIEQLPRRFVAVATERNTGCMVAFTGGDAARAVAASAALPGALAPVRVAGRWYADGGLSAPLPVRVARALGAERVIAVDTTFHAEPEVPPGIIDSVLHAGMVMSRHLARPDRLQADVLIEPQLPPVPEVTLANREQLVRAGERAAMLQLDRLRQVFSGAAMPPRPRPSPGELPLCAPAPLGEAGPPSPGLPVASG